MRLDKFLAEASVGTRKSIRNDIIEGKITVNNQVIRDPAALIEKDTDLIKCCQKEVVLTKKVYYMFHKPGGCITARKDTDSKTVLDYFDVENKEGLFPVGRLDKDTEGLLLLTNDGDFNHSLMYPDHHVEKTYFFWAFGSLEQVDKEGLESGIKIGDEEALAKAVHLKVETEGLFEDLQDKMNFENRKTININPYHQPVVSGYITITEGRRHQVKRMLKAVGCYVVYLKRVSIGGLTLDETLAKGQYRELTEKELKGITKQEMK